MTSLRMHKLFEDPTPATRVNAVRCVTQALVVLLVGRRRRRVFKLISARQRNIVLSRRGRPRTTPVEVEEMILASIGSIAEALLTDAYASSRQGHMFAIFRERQQRGVKERNAAKVITAACAEAKRFVNEHRDLISKLADTLLERGSLTRDEVVALVPERDLNQRFDVEVNFAALW